MSEHGKHSRHEIKMPQWPATAWANYPPGSILPTAAYKLQADPT